ncbi:MAG: hypothetical protein CM15mP23_09270 [Cryomorphaceae bacterium]|nr:MAG: hypothetical protein CM15mP23_09270 [Cryomorphaceae bacterium]
MASQGNSKPLLIDNLLVSSARIDISNTKEIKSFREVKNVFKRMSFEY